MSFLVLQIHFVWINLLIHIKNIIQRDFAKTFPFYCLTECMAKYVCIFWHFWSSNLNWSFKIHKMNIWPKLLLFFPTVHFFKINECFARWRKRSPKSVALHLQWFTVPAFTAPLKESTQNKECFLIFIFLFDRNICTRIIYFPQRIYTSKQMWYSQSGPNIYDARKR